VLDRSTRVSFELSDSFSVGKICVNVIFSESQQKYKMCEINYYIIALLIIRSNFFSYFLILLVVHIVILHVRSVVFITLSCVK